MEEFHKKPTYLSTYLPIYLYTHLSIYLVIWNTTLETIPLGAPAVERINVNGLDKKKVLLQQQKKNISNKSLPSAHLYNYGTM